MLIDYFPNSETKSFTFNVEGNYYYYYNLGSHNISMLLPVYNTIIAILKCQ